MRNTRLCVPAYMLLVAAGHIVSITDHAILRTFSHWFKVTFDNSNAAQYVGLFQCAFRDLRRVFRAQPTAQHTALLRLGPWTAPSPIAPAACPRHPNISMDTSSECSACF